MFSLLKSEIPVEEEEDNAFEIIAEETNQRMDDLSSEIMTLQSKTKLKSKSQSKTPTSWKEAHDQYCRTHSRLRATIPQVLEDEQEASWDLPTTHEVVTSTEYDKFVTPKKAKEEQHQASLPLPTSTSVLQLAKRVVTGIYSTALQYTRKADDVWQEPNNEEDDDFHAIDDAPWAVESEVLIVHVELTRQCYATLLDRIMSRSSHRSDQAYHRGPWTILIQSEWVPWVRHVLCDEPLACMVAEDAKWLLEILIAQKYATILQRDGKSNVVLMKSEELKASKSEQDSLQIPLALFDLQQAKISMETQLEQWAEQVQVCSTKALTFRKQGQTKLALAQLSKRKLLQQQIDTSSATLIQLEQVSASIEMAQSNQSVLTLLSQGSQLLQKLSNETSLESIDQVHEDLQDAMEQVNDIQDRLTTTTTTTAISDDDLLAELAALTIQEDIPLLDTSKLESMASELTQTTKGQSLVKTKELKNNVDLTA